MCSFRSSDAGAAVRSGLDLAQGGEFGFVLLSLAAPLGFVPPAMLQSALAAMVLSMLAAPFIIERSEHIARHISGADWLARSMELHMVAVRSKAMFSSAAMAAAVKALPACCAQKKSPLSHSIQTRRAFAMPPPQVNRSCSVTQRGAKCWWQRA